MQPIDPDSATHVEQEARSKPKDRSWFEKGGRHALDNRVSDFGPALQRVDCRTLTALDVGCAEGDITAWLLAHFARVEAIELMDDAFNKARERFVEEARVNVRQADIATLPELQMHDVIFYLGVLHYFDTEAVRAATLRHCLHHARFMCFVRSAIRDFRERDGRNPDKLNRYITIDTLSKARGDEWDMTIVDNACRGTGDRRLGDLIVYRRRADDNPFPAIETFREWMATGDSEP